jgi:hypothetical protein
LDCLGFHHLWWSIPKIFLLVETLLGHRNFTHNAIVLRHYLGTSLTYQTYYISLYCACGMWMHNHVSCQCGTFFGTTESIALVHWWRGVLLAEASVKSSLY